MALVNQHPALLERQLLQGFLDVVLLFILVGSLRAALGHRRRPAGEPLKGLGDGVLAIELDQIGRGHDPPLKLGLQLRPEFVQHEPGDAGVVLQRPAVVHEAAIDGPHGRAQGFLHLGDGAEVFLGCFLQAFLPIGHALDGIKTVGREVGNRFGHHLIERLAGGHG